MGLSTDTYHDSLVDPAADNEESSQYEEEM